MIFNPEARKLDRVQSEINWRAKCTLVDVSDWFAVGSVPPNYQDIPAIPLYTNPQTIQRSVSANYGKTNGLLSSLGSRTYLHSDREPIQLSGVIVDTGCQSSDATPYLDKLEGLVRSGINSYPPVLAIVWETRVIQPVVLTVIDIEEQSWVNGLVSQATLSLTFEYMRLPSFQKKTASQPTRRSRVGM